MSYTRTPYCFQSNYASNSYSGPSTAFNPSFERSGIHCLPSHCDVNEYQSLFSGRRIPQLYSEPSVDFLDFRSDTPPSRPANLLEYISTYPDEDSGRPPLLEVSIRGRKTRITTSGLKP